MKASKGRSLQDNYFENFAPNNGEISNELIFTSQNTNKDGGSISSFYYAQLHYNQNPGGWNGFVTLLDLYNKFIPNDSRFSASVKGLTDVSGLKAGILVGQQVNEKGENIKTRDNTPLIFTPDFSLTNSTEEKGMRVIKYQPDYSSLTRPSNDFVFLRLADVLLMKAEALARTGNTNGALEIINAIRTKRGTTPLATFTMLDVLNERARELYWEGHRRQDQIRFSTFHLPVQERNTTSDRHLLIFPIPTKKLGPNSKISQNPGY
jgi:starch-binding outer membrane protein, SusD/RagB family